MRKSTLLGVVVLGVSARAALAEDPVYFADAKLKAAVESRLGKSDPTPSDMLGLTFLQIVSGGITDLTGLEYATNLTYLYLEISQISDVSPLSGLTKLTDLLLGHNQISDISALSGLANLEKLTLYHNKYISDISPLSGLTNLTTLYINDNQVSDISVLSNLTNLTELGISINPISNISAISGLTNLTDLYMSSAQISDISAISGLTDLRLLSADYNTISDVSALAGLVKLNLVYLYHNEISDISALTGLTKLARLDLERNPLNNDAYCIYLPEIRANNPGASVTYSANGNPPVGVSASDGTYSDKVRITWDGLCGITQDVRYRVYRSESSGGTKIALADWQFSTSFEDTTVLPEMTYYYWVMARIGSYPHQYTDYSWYDTGCCGAAVVTYALTTSSTAGGSVTVPGEEVFSYDSGSSVSVGAAAEANHHFTGWTGTAVSAGKVADPGAVSTTVTMDGDYTLIANFAIDRHALTLSSTAGGSVTMPGEGGFSYDYGSSVPIVAAAEAGYHFVEWSGSLASTQNPTSIEMNADHQVTAHFAPDQHVLTVSSAEGGSVVVPGEGVLACGHGGSVRAVAVPDSGYRFAGWSGTLVEDGGVEDPNLSRIDVAVLTDSTLHASFEPVPAGIYVDDDAWGDPSPGDPTDSDPNEDGTWDHPFDTIQEAIDAAQDGEAVLVRPGTYYQNINFRGKSITVSSLDPYEFGGISQTIIDGGGIDSVVTFEAGEGANSILAGLTITGGYAEFGGGIRCFAASPVIANCVIAGNLADVGAGLWLRESDATIVNCTVADNSSTVDGGGLYCDGNATIINSIVWSNQPQQIAAEPTAVLIMYSDVQGNWPGIGNIDAAPCFAAPGYWASVDDLASPVEPGHANATWVQGDYHLKSAQGRWEPTQSVWVRDTDNSPCIDAGNRNADPRAETLPNGGRINCGAYGGTAEASQSAPEMLNE